MEEASIILDSTSHSPGHRYRREESGPSALPEPLLLRSGGPAATWPPSFPASFLPAGLSDRPVLRAPAHSLWSLGATDLRAENLGAKSWPQSGEPASAVVVVLLKQASVGRADSAGRARPGVGHGAPGPGAFLSD